MSPSAPQHCFCHYDDEALRPWVIKRFHERCDTDELLRSTDNLELRALIRLVALLDADNGEIKAQFKGKLPKGHDPLRCRETLKRHFGLA